MQKGRIPVRVMSTLWYYDIVTFEYCNSRSKSWTFLFFVGGTHILNIAFVLLCGRSYPEHLFLFDCVVAHILSIVFLLLCGGHIMNIVFLLLVVGPYPEHWFLFDFFGGHILNIVFVWLFCREVASFYTYMEIYGGTWRCMTVYMAIWRYMRVWETCGLGRVTGVSERRRRRGGK